MNDEQKTTMNKAMKTVLTALMVSVLGYAFCEQAQAAPLPQINGDIAFYGSSTASGASAPATNTTNSFSNPWNTLSSTGDYIAAGIGLNSAAATFTDFSFTGDGASVSLLGSPITPEWTFTFNNITYSFDLVSLTNGHTEQGAMSFSGTGTVHASDASGPVFADTPANWSLQGAAEEPFFFQLSSSTTSSVPEGGVMSLLGIGFALFAGKSLLRKSKAW